MEKCRRDATNLTLLGQPAVAPEQPPNRYASDLLRPCGEKVPAGRMRGFH